MDMWAIKELKLYPMSNGKPLKQCFSNLALYWNHLGRFNTIDAWIPPPEIVI